MHIISTLLYYYCYIQIITVDDIILYDLNEFHGHIILYILSPLTKRYFTQRFQKHNIYNVGILYTYNYTCMVIFYYFFLSITC